MRATLSLICNTISTSDRFHDQHLRCKLLQSKRPYPRMRMFIFQYHVHPIFKWLADTTAHFRQVPLSFGVSSATVMLCIPYRQLMIISTTSITHHCPTHIVLRRNVLPVFCVLNVLIILISTAAKLSIFIYLLGRFPWCLDRSMSAGPITWD